MPNILNLALLLGSGAALTVPLFYGLSTLRGMKHRSYVPLLRFKRRDGTILVMTTERGSVHPDGFTTKGGLPWSQPCNSCSAT